ncbi:zinc-ribbon domain-containing protein [Pendulispora brunnea]|uniref:zinc-ribbon domain-containing protein n=1 Tax=Pendulispora brunnea TaxID=2905690 RepID=UPI00374E06EF
MNGDRSLQTKHPRVAAEWHPTANGQLTPRDVPPHSHHRAWWRCPACEHEWQTAVGNRISRGSGCPACATKQRAARRGSASPENSLAMRAPAIAAEWDQAANGTLTPADVNVGAQRKVSWKCAKCARTWVAAIHQRTVKGSGCPGCARERQTGPLRPRAANSLATFAPDLAREWHRERNGALCPESVSRGSKVVVWWCCSHGHEWKAAIYSRTGQGTGCPECARARLGKRPSDQRSLAEQAPGIAAEWDHEKNGSLSPATVLAGSTRRIWWRCVQGHAWRSGVIDRVARGKTCPHCRHTPPPERALARQFPEVAREWDARKNGDLAPLDAFVGSDQRVWWRCTAGHSWQARIKNRTVNGSGCPRCKRGNLTQTTSGTSGHTAEMPGGRGRTGPR